jgi:hypothetical protein
LNIKTKKKLLQILQSPCIFSHQESLKISAKIIRKMLAVFWAKAGSQAMHIKRKLWFTAVQRGSQQT